MASPLSSHHIKTLKKWFISSLLLVLMYFEKISPQDLSQQNSVWTCDFSVFISFHSFDFLSWFSLFLSRLFFSVGNMTRTHNLKDAICEHLPLCHRLFSVLRLLISCLKRLLAAELLV
eukprot:TRINITY_DN17773_c0_g2_i1.p1 TRINITY_DN17773_c0_g2~~TRINITY_DN17773_c0_g2_i1.p1  ORF type:complete len:118 (-),score=8.30 TRINITY_DN17773_c0_g2_i1:228-581(-)